MRLTKRSIAGLLLSVLLVAGCSADPDDTPSPSSTESTTSASASPTPTVETGQGGEDEAAAAMAALAAYNGGWAMVVQSYRDPGAKPNWELDYRQYITEPELSEALGYVYGLRDAGVAHPSGDPVRNPAAARVDLDAQVVEVRDCVDLSAWPQVFVATGVLNSTPQPPFVIEARVIYDAAAARWLVTEQTPLPDQPC